MTEQDTSPVVEQSFPPEMEPPAQDVTSQDVTGPNVAEQDVKEQDVSQSTSAGTTDTDESTQAVSGAPASSVASASAPKSRAGTTSTSALEREGEVAADFLEQLLDIADMDGDIDVDVDGDRAAVAIVDSEEGRVSRRLVGADGKVLDALQELTRLAVQAATGERSRLMLDVAGFRAERRAAVVAVAQTAIATVRSTNDKVAMASMTAFERKVVHDQVLAAGLISESEGMEPQRHVVILPA